MEAQDTSTGNDQIPGTETAGVKMPWDGCAEGDIANRVYHWLAMEGVLHSLSWRQLGHDAVQISGSAMKWERERCRQQWESEVAAVLERIPGAVRVCEGGGPENLAASLAVSVAKLTEQLAELPRFRSAVGHMEQELHVLRSREMNLDDIAEYTESIQRLKDSNAEKDKEIERLRAISVDVLMGDSEYRKKIESQLEERSCLLSFFDSLEARLPDGDKVRSPLQVTREIAEKLAQQDAAIAELKKEIELRKKGQDAYRAAGEQVLTESVAKDAEIAKLRDAIRRAGFAVMETAGNWSIHDVSEFGKQEQEKTARTIAENIELQIARRELVEALRKAKSLLHSLWEHVDDSFWDTNIAPAESEIDAILAKHGVGK